MRHWQVSLLTRCAALALLLAAQTGLAVTPQELLEEDRLRARITIDSSPPISQQVPFILAVEISTPRWFTRGTRVRDFRIPGAVVRPVSSFADNLTRREDGQSWSVQRWRFRVFPRIAGSLEIPPLRVFVSINTGEQTAVEGELVLQHAAIEIIPPPGVTALENWVATPSLRVEERWEGLRDSYLPGDAVTRTRRFVIEDVPAMMLPGSDADAIPGLSLYAAPPTVTDESTRGSLRGTREETLVVTFETPGVYEIPGLNYGWFNTASGDIEYLRLPAVELVVAGEALAANPSPEPSTDTFSTVKLVVAGLLLALFIAALASWNRPPVQRARQHLAHRVGQRQSHWRYMRGYKVGDSALCVQLLHAELTRRNPGTRLWLYFEENARHRASDAGYRDTLRSLLAHAYGGEATLPSRHEVRRLYDAVCRNRERQTPVAELRMNPRSTQQRYKSAVS